MTPRAWALFVAMCVIWGIPYLLIKVAVEELSPALLVLARTAFAALLLLPFASRRGELRPLAPYWAPVLAFAAIEIALPWWLLGVAEQQISSSLTAMLIAGVPLVAAVIALSTGRERLGVASGVGLLLGLVGVAAIVGVSFEGEVWAMAAAGLVAVCYAIGPVIVQRRLDGVPALGVIAAALAVTALAFVPIAASRVPDAMPSADAVAATLGLSVVCTALAFVLFFALIGEIGPMRATVITYVNPAVAAVLGVAILGERFTVGMGVGFVLVLVGSLLATRQSAVAPASRDVDVYQEPVVVRDRV